MIVSGAEDHQEGEAKVVFGRVILEEDCCILPQLPIAELVKLGLTFTIINNTTTTIAQTFQRSIHKRLGGRIVPHHNNNLKSRSFAPDARFSNSCEEIRL